MKTRYSFYELNLMTVIVSFLGFLLENCWLAVTEGYMDNRSMNLPFLLGYGLTIIGFYIVVGTPQKLRMGEKFHMHLSRRGSYILYFLIAMVIVSIGEVMLGTFVEKKFGFEYWNYSQIPFHITKYTSIPTSIGFAAVITAFMGFFYDPLMRCIQRMPERAVKLIGIMLMAMVVTDFLVCFKSMYVNHSVNVIWNITKRGFIRMY